jgi:Guanylate kinase
MGKIYFLMGKSASGKDTIYGKLLGDERLKLLPYVGYTTRPIRSGESEGVEYHFTTKEDLDAFEQSGKLIEKRVYHTVLGDWYYYSVDSDDLDLDRKDYLYIGTLESYVKMRDYYGADKVVPIYIEIEDGLRLQRALDREKSQAEPKYLEMCRRFIADSADFSEENLAAAGISVRFENISVTDCINEILQKVFSVI